MNKLIEIPNTCEPYMYNTSDDLKNIRIGDVITLKFGNKKYKVKKEYIGKEIQFVVNNLFHYERWSTNYQRLALIPLNKQDAFEEEDILFLDKKERFESLISALFPCNRKIYNGWENKTVEILSITK
jgi:hypothetical protein